MKTMFKKARFTVAVAAAAFMAIAGTLAAGDVQKMVPPDATVSVYIPDFTKLETQWKSTFLYKFTKDPQVENFILPLRKQIDAMSQSPGSAEHKALLSHFKGEMSFNVSGLTLKDGSPDASLVIIAEHASDPAQVQESLKKFVESQGKVDSQTSADFMGVKIYSMKVNQNQAAPIPGADPAAPTLATQDSLPFHFVILPKHMILSSGEDKAIKQVVQLSQQPGPTLFDTTEFKSAFTGDYSGFPMIAFINIRSVLVTADQALKASGTGASLAGNGLEPLQSFGLAFNLKPDQIETWSVLSAPGAKSGISKLFFPDEKVNFDQALKIVPESAASFSITSFSVPVLWATIKQAVNTTMPQYGQMINMYIMQANMTLQFDIEKDLIDTLGSDLIQYSKAGAASTPASGMGAGLGSMGLENSVLLLGLKDSAKFQASIAKAVEVGKAMSGGQDMVEKTDFMGYSVYQVKTPPAGPGTPATPSPAFMITPSHFVFSSNIEDVKDVARAIQGKGAKSILESAEFKAAYEKAKGPNLKSLGYSSSEAMKQMSMALGQMASLAMLDPDNQLNSMFNFAAVPPPAVFQKYFGTQISTSEQQADRIIGHYVFNAGK